MQQQGNDGTNECIGHIFLSIPYVTLGDELYTVLFTTEYHHGKPLNDLVPGADGADKKKCYEITQVPGNTLMVKNKR